MSVNETIVANLQRAMKANRPLDLLSTFKGVPVRYKASIRKIQDEVVSLQALPPEAVCLEFEREVVVLGEGSEEALRADVVEVRLAEGTAQLAHLRYADTRLGNRLMVRVEPKEPIGLQLQAGGQSFQGELADVSMGGLAVQMLSPDPNLALKIRAPVRMTLNLPSGPIELVGIIRSAKQAAGGKRLGIAFPQDAQLSTIVGYILQRRVEILAELKAAYEARVGKK
jgi:hypothetical protein